MEEKLHFAAFLLQNWEVLSLIVTNILALYVKSPLDRRKEK